MNRAISSFAKKVTFFTKDWILRDPATFPIFGVIFTGASLMFVFGRKATNFEDVYFLKSSAAKHYNLKPSEEIGDVGPIEDTSISYKSSVSNKIPVYKFDHRKPDFFTPIPRSTYVIDKEVEIK